MYNYNGILLAVLSSVLSSIGSIYQAISVKALGALVVASIGSLLAAGILALFIITTKRRFEISKLYEYRRDLFMLVIFRAVIASIFFNLGMQYTSGIKVIFFTKIEPYFVLLWGWVLEKQRSTRSDILLLAVHLCGALILSSNGNFHFDASNWGDLLVFLGIACVSVTYVYARRLSMHIGAVTVNAISCACGGIILLPFALAYNGKAIWNFNNPQVEIGWKYLLIYLVLFNIFALSLWYGALRSVKPWLVSAFRATGPLIGAPFAWYFFAEKLSPLQIIGGALILITSAGLVRRHAQDKKISREIE